LQVAADGDLDPSDDVATEAGGEGHLVFRGGEILDALPHGFHGRFVAQLMAQLRDRGCVCDGDRSDIY
jgi:hypothetical protein